MTDRYDAVAARKYEVNGEERSSFTNIGVAFRMRDKDGYSIRLHAIPAPVDGEYTILLFPPKPRDDARHEPRQSTRKQSYADARGGKTATAMQEELDDEIPF